MAWGRCGETHRPHRFTLLRSDHRRSPEGPLSGVRSWASFCVRCSLALPSRYQCRLKYCTARSCFSAADRVLKVPRFRRRLVFGSSFREYNRYSPERSLRIMNHRAPNLIDQARN
jgi:hypothetical protein